MNGIMTIYFYYSENDKFEDDKKNLVYSAGVSFYFISI